MKKLLFITSLSVGFVVLLSGCGSPAPPTIDTVKVLESYYGVLTNSDLDKAISYVADDVVFIDPMGKYVGLEEIRGVYGGQTNIVGHWEPSVIKDVNGKGRLVYQFKGFINDLVVFSGPDGGQGWEDHL